MHLSTNALYRIDTLYQILMKCYQVSEGSKWFTIIDLASAYWQIQLRRKDRLKTAFLIRNGQYQFKVMLFGLNNALVTFQRLMNKVLRQYIGKFVQIYLDDVIIYSSTSVPSERLFSSAGNTLTKKRNRLNPTSVHDILFLKENFSKFNILLSFR